MPTERARLKRRAADIIGRSSLPEDHPMRVEYSTSAELLEKIADAQQAPASPGP